MILLFFLYLCRNQKVMKRIKLLLAALLLTLTAAYAQETVYGFTVKDAAGKDVSLSQYQGKVLLVVNTATKCGFTPQYKELQDLYEKYQASGLEILDFPCNQFGGQAPGTMEEIRDFCTGKYHTTFPQFLKIDVNGPDADPLFVWLYGKKGFEGFGSGMMAKSMDKMLKAKDADYASKPEVKWNFTKFLIDKEGKVVARFEPTASMEEVGKAVAEQL